MNQLISYINNSKSFKEEKFNEIDASIYTILSYLNFTGIINKPISIKDAYKIYMDRFRLKDKDIFNKKNIEIFGYLAKSIRFKDNIITDFQTVEDKTTQFGAIAIKVPHCFKFIAFRGTNDLLVGWEENFMMSYTYPIPSQTLAIKFLKKNIKFNDLVVYVGGHSKGGNLAIYSLMNQNIINRWKVIYCFNLDGPGFRDVILDSNKYKRIVPKLRNYYPTDSLVGMIMDQDGDKRYVKSTAKGVNEHSLHSWKIDNNHFKYGELSSIGINNHLWVENLYKIISIDKRKEFFTTFFNLLYISGYTLKSELKQLSVNKITSLIKETNSLDKNKKKLLLETIKIILKTKEKG